MTIVKIELATRSRTMSLIRIRKNVSTDFESQIYRFIRSTGDNKQCRNST